MRRVITERRASGVDENQKDLLTSLVRASSDGEAMTMREVMGSE